MPAREQVAIEFLGESAGAQRASRETVGAIQRVEHQSHKTSTAVKHHAEEAVAANALLTGSFTRMASRAVAAGAGFTAAYIGIAKAKDAITSTVELAHNTELLHRNLGLATKSASGLESVLKARGIDASSAAMAFQTLSRQVLAAETGNKRAAAAFNALGISTKDLLASHNDMNVLLPKVAEGFGQIKGGADRAAVAQVVLSRGFRSLLPLFAGGAKGFNDQMKAAQEFGAVLDDKTLKQLNTLHDAQIKNKLAALGLKVAFTQAATPALLELSKITQKVAKDFQGPGSLDDKIGRVGHDLAPALKRVEKTFEAAIPVIANHVGRDAPKVALAFVRGFENADIWGKLAIGAFLLKATGAWKLLSARAGAAAGTAFGSNFLLYAGAAIAGWEIGSLLYDKVPEVRHAADAIAQVLTDALHPHIKIWMDPLPNIRVWFGNARPNEADANAKTDAQGLIGSLGANPGAVMRGMQNGGLSGLAPVPKGAPQRMSTVLGAAQKYGVDPSILWGIYGAESSFGKAKSSFGLTSDYPGKGTSGNFGTDANRAAQILSNLLASQGGYEAALRKYSGGGYGLAHIHDVLANKAPAAGGGPGTKSYLDYLNQANAKPGKADTTPAALAWARQMIGHFKESTGFNTGPELDNLQKEFGTHAAAWCAEFATKALVKAGFPKDIMTARVSDLNAWAKAGVRGLGFTNSPNPGDLMTFGNKHVAIVESVDTHKGVVHTIAGNTGQGDVSRSTYALGAGRYISADPLAAGGTLSPGQANKPSVVRVPKLTQQDFSNFIQGKTTTFDLMVAAGLLSPAAANSMKRQAILEMLPNLTGDTKLGALGQLRALPTPLKFEKGVERQGWASAAAGYFTGQAARTVNTTIDNPWLQAAMNRIDLQVGAGNMTQEQGNAKKSAILGSALPHLSGDNGLIAQGMIRNLAPGDTGVADEGKRLSTIDQHQHAGDITASDATAQKIASLKDALDNWNLTDDARLELRAELGDLTAALQDNTAAQADMTDFWKQRAEAMTQAYQISQSQYQVFSGTKISGMPFLGGFDAGGTVPGPRGAAGLALVHGGETVLPTHKGGGLAPNVNVYVSADAVAAGVRVDHQIGRDARQRSVAPGR